MSSAAFSKFLEDTKALHEPFERSPNYLDGYSRYFLEEDEIHKAILNAALSEGDGSFEDLDPFAVYLKAARTLRDSGSVLLDRTPMKNRVVEFSDARFSEIDRKLLEVIVDAYGDDVVVAFHGESWVVNILHEDFITQGQRERLSARPSGYEEIFRVRKPYNEHTLFHCLLWYVPNLSEGLSARQALLRPVLGTVGVAGDGVRHIPTWTGRTLDWGEGTPYEEIPTLGEPAGIPDPDLLLTDGVVVGIGGVRYRVWFDFNDFVSENGWGDRPFSGEHVLRMQRTDDPVTTVPLDPENPHRIDVMLGHGYSQQGFSMAPFCGQEPRCLIVFEVDRCDYTFCVMVTLDSEGEVEFAWVEGSCT